MKTKAEADVEINSMMISSVSDLGKAWFCSVCNFSHKKKDNVFRHVDQLHYQFSFSCETCGSITPTLYALYYHNKIHHKQWTTCNVLFLEVLLKTKNEAEIEINSMMTNNFDYMGNKSWFCNICNFSHKRKQFVFRHVDQLHYTFSYSCDICGKITSTMNAMFFHKRDNHKEAE